MVNSAKVRLLTQVLQSQRSIITNRESSRYQKVGEEILQSEVDNLLQNKRIIIRKRGRFYKVG